MLEMLLCTALRPFPVSLQAWMVMPMQEWHMLYMLCCTDYTYNIVSQVTHHLPWEIDQPKHVVYASHALAASHATSLSCDCYFYHP